MNKSIERTLERILQSFHGNSKGYRFEADQEFLSRLNNHFEQLTITFHELYGNQYDFYPFFEELIYSIYDSWKERDTSLKTSDQKRESDPFWFKSEKMIGAVCYVDLFAEDLSGIKAKIPYLEELGVTYLHLMPLFKSPSGENDGGYAVSSYREVNEELGTIKELKELITKLREKEISVVLDFINNHTSNEHLWAKKALEGNERFKEFYFFFPDRSTPDAYDAHLREIFPQVRRGNFTRLEETGEWVWTTFHSYQWDLNYKNPEVFISMAKEMLFLANLGVEILRFDAVPFIWKEMGSSSENLSKAHTLIKALNSVARIAAPSLLFKSEAIVHPDEVAKYIDKEECQLSYNPGLMALLWEALATREVRLLNKFLQQRFNLSEDTTWVNYVRSHDDIGWTFSDDDAAQLGINGYNHRQFLNQFYSGEFPGSFSRGVKFQMNPENNDMRICGTTASLAGLELAKEFNDNSRIDDAIKRIQLLYGIILSIGGIPLIYLGDEIGTLNDYSYSKTPEKKEDSRWVHRIATDWEKVNKVKSGNGEESEVLKGLLQMIQIRKKQSAFRSGTLSLIETNNAHILAYLKQVGEDKVLVIANFSESRQTISSEGLAKLEQGEELKKGLKIDLTNQVHLQGYDLFWIKVSN